MHFVAALDRIPGMRCVLVPAGERRHRRGGRLLPHGRQAGRDAAALRPGPGKRPCRTCTTRAAPAPASSTWSATRRPTTVRSMRRSPPTPKAGRGRSRPSCAPAVVEPRRRRRRRGGAGRAHAAGRHRHADPAQRRVVGRRRRGRPRRCRCPLRRQADPHAVQQAARVLREKKNVLLLLGGEALHRALAAARLAHRRDDRRQADDRGLQRPHRARPGPPAARARALSRRRRGQGAGAVRAPDPGQRRAAGRLLRLSGQAEPALHGRAPRSTCSAASSRTPEAALQALVDELGAPAAGIPGNGPKPAIVQRQADAGRSRHRIAAVLPEGAVIVDEIGELRPRLLPQHPCRRAARLAADHGRRDRRRHSASGGEGNRLRGDGRNDRRVLALQADGSAMYTCRACGRRRARSCR